MVLVIDKQTNEEKKKNKIKKLLSYYITYKLINNLMKKGKKDKAINILNKVILKLNVNLNRDAFYLFSDVIKYISPPFRLKKKRIAGKNFSIPLFIPVKTQINYGVKYLVKNSRERNEKNIELKLFNELCDIDNSLLNNISTNSISLKKRKELCRIAIENKYYIKYL